MILLIVRPLSLSGVTIFKLVVNKYHKSVQRYFKPMKWHLYCITWHLKVPVLSPRLHLWIYSRINIKVELCALEPLSVGTSIRLFVLMEVLEVVLKKLFWYWQDIEKSKFWSLVSKDRGREVKKLKGWVDGDVEKRVPRWSLQSVRSQKFWENCVFLYKTCVTAWQSKASFSATYLEYFGGFSYEKSVRNLFSGKSS